MCIREKNFIENLQSGPPKRHLEQWATKTNFPAPECSSIGLPR